MKNQIALSIAISTLLGCSGIPAQFAKTGDITLPSITDKCNISVYTTVPKKEYTELGIIEFFKDSQYELDKLKEIAKPLICENGGNAMLVWEVSGHGYYTRATVVSVSK